MSRRSKPFTGNLGDVDLRLLKVFRLVVESGGFAGAEAALGTGKSTISKHISDLEERLGVNLCRRGRSGFGLTAEGEQIFQATQQLFTSLEDFKSRVNAVHARLVGTLCLGFVDTVVTDAASPLTLAIAEFAREAPDVHLRLSVGSTTEIERGVLDSTLHAGVVVARSPLPGLDYEPLYRERSLLYCARGHPLYDQPDAAITPEVLADCDFVRRSYSEDEQTTALKGMFTPAATADHAEAVAMLVLGGRFIGYLPEHYAAAWVASGELRALSPQTMNYATSLIVVTRSSRAESTVVDRFLETLEAARKRTAG
jgi:DNA-binding transcriptional LysR family regulator